MNADKPVGASQASITYRGEVDRADAISYSIGDRVVWVQKTGVRPMATVVDVSPSGESIRIRFDERQRHFDSVEVWIDKRGIRPEGTSDG